MLDNFLFGPAPTLNEKTKLILPDTPTQAPTPTPLGSGTEVIYFCEENQELRNQELGTDSYDIHSIKTDGSQKTKITNNQDKNVSFHFPVISPDGKRIAFVKGRFIKDSLFGNHYACDVYIMNIDGTEIQKISSYPQYNGRDLIENYIYEGEPSWSPDGKKLSIISNRHTFKTGNRNYDNEEIYIIDLDSFEYKKLTTSTGYIEHPSWSSDGKEIAFMSNRTGHWNISVMNSDGSGKPINVTNNKFSNRFPAWSPDGKWIVFHSDMDGNEELYIIRPDGNSLTRLTKNPATDATASWSPDSNWIVFFSDRSGIDELYLLNINSKETKQLTKSGANKGWAEWGK